MILTFQALGLSVAALAILLILWSIGVPAKRVWPSHKPTHLTNALIWSMTALLSAAILALAVLGWGEVALPIWLRFGAGLPLLLAGNVVVWREAGRFGAKQTMGGKGTLKTDGFYRYSRHPQYVADIAICAGWFLVSASMAALPVIGAAVIVLLLAPFAEEPWLEERHPDTYRQYRRAVRRYL